MPCTLHFEVLALYQDQRLEKLFYYFASVKFPPVSFDGMDLANINISRRLSGGEIAFAC